LARIGLHKSAKKAMIQEKKYRCKEFKLRNILLEKTVGGRKKKIQGGMESIAVPKTKMELKPW